MNEITWKYVKPLKDEMAVKNFLKKYNVTLPALLIECLENNNGGRPLTKLFDTDASKECVFKSLLSYNQNDIENIYIIYPYLFKNNTLFPIATDAAGNFICYDTYNGIYVLFKHETNKIEKIVFGILEIFNFCE